MGKSLAFSRKRITSTGFDRVVLLANLQARRPASAVGSNLAAATAVAKAASKPDVRLLRLSN